jgi:signal transduction histidine kinase
VALVFEETPAEVMADPGRLEQALSNLVANAIRFTPDGGEVRLSAHALPSGDIRLHVADTGVGLSAADQARVFERFFKQDVSRSRGGTGLGLSIVRAIAHAHGGQATVASTPGHGSTFSVAIPPDS